MLYFGIDSPEETTKKELLGPAASEPEQLRLDASPALGAFLPWGNWRKSKIGHVRQLGQLVCPYRRWGVGACMNKYGGIALGVLH
jgi:hypothetical protein